MNAAPNVNPPNINAFISRLYEAGGGPAAPAMIGPFTLVANAANAEIMLRNPDIFRKNYGAMELLGQSRFNANDEVWQARRDLTQRFFNGAAAPANRGAVTRIFEESLDEALRTVDASGGIAPNVVTRALLKATTRVFFSVFGADHDTTALIDGFDYLRQLIERMQTASLCDARAIDPEAMTRRIAAVRRDILLHAAGVPGIEGLLARLRSEGAQIDGFEAVDELVANFFAAIESSAVALGWAMAMVCTQAALQEDLRSEAEREGERPGMETFLNEVLRVFPPIPMVTRLVAQDYVSPAFSVNAGHVVVLSVIGVHHDPSEWSEPTRFDPRRREFRERSFNRRAFIPFLYGSRVCGGAALARVELTEGLAALLRRFTFTRLRPSVPYRYALAMRPVLDGALAIRAV